MRFIDEIGIFSFLYVYGIQMLEILSCAQTGNEIRRHAD